MKRVIGKLLGALFLTVATVLFIAFTASINAAQSMGGPMNMSPSSEEWFYVVLVFDAVLLAGAWAGIKLFGLRRQAIGVLSILTGLIVLSLVASNHINAPPLDGINETNMMPVPSHLHYTVYCFVGVCLCGGVWLIKGAGKRKIQPTTDDSP